MKFVRNNWQGFVFSAVGFFALYHFYLFLQGGKVTEAGIVFGFAFLSFLYANLSRFKRFSGLGFEAELWEDKQKEASDLIDRLKHVVAIYTSEIVRGSVQQGRFADGQRWKKIWPLFDELISRHNELGQKIDFSELKRETDTYFLFDMCMNVRGFNKALFDAQSAVGAVINKEFGPIIHDSEKHSKRLAQQRDITFRLNDPFEIASRTNLAAEMLRIAADTRDKIKERFDVELALPTPDRERLEAISEAWQQRPLKVTPELIAWADRNSDD